MKYIYTKDLCGACIDLKSKYKEQGIEFIERDGNRLSNPGDDRDEVDQEAFVQLSMQNMIFPVEVDV